MNPINRLVGLGVAAVLVAAGILILSVIGNSVEPADMPGDLFLRQLTRIDDSTNGELATNYGIAIGLIAGGLVLLGMEFRPVFAGRRMVLISGGQEGSVRLDIESVRELAERTGQGNRAVRKVRCGVKVTAAGLRINCRLSLNLGTDVPEVSASVQESIKDVIERLTGLPVVDVTVKANYDGGGDLPLLAR